MDFFELREKWTKRQSADGKGDVYDSGWRKVTGHKDEFGNTIKTKNVAKHLAKKGRAAAEKMQKEDVEQIDELKKSTYANYIKKAVGASRGAATLAKQFDDDSYKPLKKMNRHSKNIIQYNKKGERKKVDPKKYAKAKDEYETLKGLSDKFRNKSNNRVVGIKRAANALAKEDVQQEAKMSFRDKMLSNMKWDGKTNKVQLDKNSKFAKDMAKKTNIKMGKTKVKEETELSEASQKLIKYMQGKHGIDTLKKMKPAEMRAAQKAAQAEMKAGAGKKAPEPKKVTKTAKGKTHVGSADAADKHIIMQMRKAQDYGQGTHSIRVSPTREVKVNHKVINAALKKHDSMAKPEHKRKFRVDLIRALRKQGN